MLKFRRKTRPGDPGGTTTADATVWQNPCSAAGGLYVVIDIYESRQDAAERFDEGGGAGGAVTSVLRASKATMSYVSG